MADGHEGPDKFPHYEEDVNAGRCCLVWEGSLDHGENRKWHHEEDGEDQEGDHLGDLLLNVASVGDSHPVTFKGDQKDPRADQANGHAVAENTHPVELAYQHDYNVHWKIGGVEPQELLEAQTCVHRDLEEPHPVVGEVVRVLVQIVDALDFLFLFPRLSFTCAVRVVSQD